MNEFPRLRAARPQGQGLELHYDGRGGLLSEVSCFEREKTTSNLFFYTNLHFQLPNFYKCDKTVAATKKRHAQDSRSNNPTRPVEKNGTKSASKKGFTDAHEGAIAVP